MALKCGVILVLSFVISLARLDPLATASLAGRVTESTGRPLRGVIVQLRHSYSGNVAETVTSPQGTYEITRMRSGRYSVLATAEGYGCVWKPAVFLFEGRRTELNIVFSGNPEDCVASPRAVPAAPKIQAPVSSARRSARETAPSSATEISSAPV